MSNVTIFTLDGVSQQSRVIITNMKATFSAARSNMKLFKTGICDELLPYVYPRWVFCAMMTLSLVTRLYCLQLHFGYLSAVYGTWTISAIHSFFITKQTEMLHKTSSQVNKSISEFEIWILLCIYAVVTFGVSFISQFHLRISQFHLRIRFGIWILCFLSCFISARFIKMLNNDYSSKSSDSLRFTILAKRLKNESKKHEQIMNLLKINEVV